MFIQVGEGEAADTTFGCGTEEKQIIEKRGSWLNYKGTQLAQGRDAGKEALKNDPKLYEEIETAVKAKLDEEKE